MALAEAGIDPGTKAVATECLWQLAASDSSITLAVLTSEDGFEIASYRAREISGRIAAMSSSLQALSAALAREARIGGTKSLIIEAHGGAVVVLGLETVSRRASLSIVSSGGPTLGQLLWAGRNCCTELEQALGR